MACLSGYFAVGDSLNSRNVGPPDGGAALGAAEDFSGDLSSSLGTSMFCSRIHLSTCFCVWGVWGLLGAFPWDAHGMIGVAGGIGISGALASTWDDGMITGWPSISASTSVPAWFCSTSWVYGCCGP